MILNCGALCLQVACTLLKNVLKACILNVDFIYGSTATNSNHFSYFILVYISLVIIVSFIVK